VLKTQICFIRPHCVNSHRSLLFSSWYSWFVLERSHIRIADLRTSGVSKVIRCVLQPLQIRYNFAETLRPTPRPIHRLLSSHKRTSNRPYIYVAEKNLVLSPVNEITFSPPDSSDLCRFHGHVKETGFRRPPLLIESRVNVLQKHLLLIRQQVNWFWKHHRTKPMSANTPFHLVGQATI